MATEEQQQELLDTLKFTPVTYTLTLSGYGGEIAVGRVERKVYDYFTENGIDLEEFAWDYDNELEVPEDLQPFGPGEWYDCDGIAHESGVEMGDCCWAIVSDQNGETVWEHTLSLGELRESLGDDAVTETWEISTDDLEPGTVVFTGQSFEKGTFFEGDIYLTRPFDPKLLAFSYQDVCGWLLSTGVTYDGVDIEGQDNYSTTGKSSNFEFELIDQ